MWQEGLEAGGWYIGDLADGEDGADGCKHKLLFLFWGKLSILPHSRDHLRFQCVPYRGKLQAPRGGGKVTRDRGVI